MKYYTVYKVTNKVNGKFYVGAHQTYDLNDCYMGSGELIKDSIQKYGLDNFTKEILFVYDNPEDMFSKEAEIVNEDFIAEENTYNLRIGGFGGWNYVNRNVLTKEQRILGGNNAAKKTNEYFKYNPDRRVVPNWKGRKHTKESINKMKLIDRSGKRNSQYGTMWITNGSENKKVKKEEIIPEGWYKGRKLNSV